MADCALKQRLSEDMKTAMRSKDTERLAVIRLALAALKQREVDERITLDDTQVLAVLDNMVKQRRDSLAQYEAANHKDLADKEAFEIQVLQTYMPTALSEAELSVLIAEAIGSAGAAGPQDMGKVMNALRPKVQGRADMGAVSALVKAKLSSA